MTTLCPHGRLLPGDGETCPRCHVLKAYGEACAQRELTRRGPVMPEEQVRRARLFAALCKPAPPDPLDFEDPDYGL